MNSPMPLTDKQQVPPPAPTVNVEETEQVLESMRQLSNDEARRKDIERILV